MSLPQPDPARGTPHADEAQRGETLTAQHERRTWWVAGVNLAAMVAQVVGGLILSSAAVVADGVHMGAHVGAVLMAGLAYRIASRRRTLGDRVGARRVVDGAAALNAFFLFVLAGLIVMESWSRLQAPEPIAFVPALLLVVFGLGVNAVSIALLHDRPAASGARGRDMNFRAIYLHMVGDAGVGVLALFGLSAVKFLGWIWADAAAGFLGAALVALLAVQVLSPLLTPNAQARSRLSRLDQSAS